MSNLVSRRNLIVLITLIQSTITIPYVMAFQKQSHSFTFQSAPSFCDHENNIRKRTRGDYSSTSLFMGKMKNKQAELQRKMMLAKQQRANEDDAESSSKAGEDKRRMTDQELKEMNDRKRFEELLNSQSASIGATDAKSSENYLSEEQEEENIDAYRKGVNRLFEGDPAPSEAFEELISIKSENAIGGPAVKGLIPWLRNTNKSDYIVVVSDARIKSPEFLNTVKALSSELPTDILNKILFINADTPAQNRRFLKKNNISDSHIRLYSDEKREWMQAYTALGENRWSMTLFVLADGRIQKLVREFSTISASNVVENAIKAMEKRRL